MGDRDEVGTQEMSFRDGPIVAKDATCQLPKLKCKSHCANPKNPQTIGGTRAPSLPWKFFELCVEKIQLRRINNLKLLF